MSFTLRPIREDKKNGRFRKCAVIATGVLEAAVHLYHQMKHREEETVESQKRVRLLKRATLVLLSGLLILLFLIGTLNVLVRMKMLSLGTMVSVVSTPPAHDERGNTNVLLLGEGDNDHDGVDLTDTIMVVSLDPVHTESAVMLSLPRDLYLLSTEKMGKGRINSLYRDYKAQLVRGGMEKGQASKEAMTQLAKEIGDILGLSIHGTIKLNFSGFEQAIDALGGIDVTVPEDLVDPEYPGQGYTYVTFQIGKGLQHMSGATALKYARSRHSTSDFSRSARQQQIIVAASEKAKSAGLLTHPRKINDLFGIVSQNMETTFAVRELFGLADLGKRIDHGKIVNVQLSDQNGLFGGLSEKGGFLYAPPREQFDGAAVFLPVSIPEFPVTWKQIQTLVKLLIDHRDVFIDPPRILIANAGAKEGSARLLGAELTRYGFNVVKTRNFAKKPNPSFDRSWMSIRPDDAAKHAKTTATLLAKIFAFAAAKNPPEGTFGEEQADLVIVLGKDYHYTALQDLIR